MDTAQDKKNKVIMCEIASSQGFSFPKYQMTGHEDKNIKDGNDVNPWLKFGESYSQNDK
jgi:hypothetical protein